jgi:hypothetical protein
MGWIAKLAGLAIPSWGIYAAMAAAAAAIWGHGAFWGYEKGMENYNNLRISNAAQAAEQEANTKSTIKAHQKLMEAINEKARLQKEVDAAKLDIATKQLRDATRSKSRLLSPSPGSPPGDIRVCASRDQLDSEVSGAINRVVERHATRNLQLAQEGARAAAVAKLCREWALEIGAK